MRKLCTILLIITFGLSTALWGQELNSKAFPDALPTIDAHVHTTEALNQGTLVLNFWFVACYPCLKEIPDLERLTKDINPTDPAKFIAISPFDDVEQLSYFKSRRGFGFELVANRTFAAHLDITTYPTTIVFQNGKEVYRSEGYNINLYEEVVDFLADHRIAITHP